MIEKLYFHMNQSISDVTRGVDDPWKNAIRSHIFCRNQEEHDYLSALNLMHGREIEINVWDEWRSVNRELRAGGGTRLRVLPLAYTTWYCNLKGF